MNEALWDERYRASGAVWSGEPNDQLVRELAGLAPGSALEAGSGEGADAMWLARRGWHVTAVDISSVALQRSAALAEQAAPDVARRITWVHLDLATAAPPGGAYDLVTAHFMHFPPPERDVFFRRLAERVAPSGTLLVVGHDPSDLLTAVRRPRQPGVLYAAADIAALLDPLAWDILVCEPRPRSAIDTEGRTVTIHDAVLRAYRRPAA